MGTKEPFFENREVRAHLDHPDWEDETAAVSAEASSPGRSQGSSQASTPEKWQIVEARNDTPEKKQKVLPEKPPFTDLSSAPGPLTIVCRKVKSPAGTLMVHLLTCTGKAIGCGWQPLANSYDHLLEQDYRADQSAYSLCSKCFRLYSLPQDWTATDPSVHSEVHSSCGSLSDDSVDSESDQEAVQISLKEQLP